MSASVPSLYISSKSAAEGSGTVLIVSRKDAAHSGQFKIKIAAGFNPSADDYPTGSFQIQTDLSDSVKAVFSATSIEEINSLGKHNPTIYLTGRCKVKPMEDIKEVVGCRYWLMIADNKTAQEAKGTPDIVSFVIHDRNGNRIAYGTGPVVKGDIVVKAS